jgi:hypothetical protein
LAYRATFVPYAANGGVEVAAVEAEVVRV